VFTTGMVVLKLEVTFRMGDATGTGLTEAVVEGLAEELR